MQSPVGVYFDDVYFSNANATGQPIFDVARVEVVEGPQGTLWGKNTTGGAVNIVSVKPSFQNSGYAKVAIGSYDKQLYEAAFGGGINDWLAARASFHAEKGGGTPFKSALDGSKPDFHDDAGRIQFLADITPDLSALLNIHFRDYSASGSLSSAVSTAPDGLFYSATTTTPNIYASSDPQVTVGTPISNTNIRQNGVALTLTQQLNGYTLTSISGYEDFKTDAFSDGATYYSPTQAITNSNSKSNAHTRQFSEEIRLASPREDRNNWVIGAMYFTEDISSNSISATLPNAVTGTTQANKAPSWSNSTLSQNTDSYAIFASDTFNFTQAFNVTAGLRYTLEEKSDNYLRRGASGKSVATGGTDNAPFSNPAAWWQESSVSSPISTVAKQQASKSWGAWTYDITPEYKFSDNLRSYLRYAHGFRSGGFNTAALTQLAVDANGGVVNPEYLDSYELGLKSEWFDNRLIINGNIFYYNYDDIQVNIVQSIPDGLGGTRATSVLTNAANGIGKGAQLNLQIRPIENLTLNLASAFLHTEYKNYSSGTPGTANYADYTGNRFVRSPRFSQVASVDYKLPLANGDAVLFSTDWKYQSKQYYYGNEQIHDVYAQKGYTVGNARVSYVTGKLTLAAYVDNLTDELYKVHSGTVSSDYYNNSNTVNWSPGRTFGTSATVKF